MHWLLLGWFGLFFSFTIHFSFSLWWPDQNVRLSWKKWFSGTRRLLTRSLCKELHFFWSCLCNPLGSMFCLAIPQSTEHPYRRSVYVLYGRKITTVIAVHVPAMLSASHCCCAEICNRFLMICHFGSCRSIDSGPVSCCSCTGKVCPGSATLSVGNSLKYLLREDWACALYPNSCWSVMFSYLLYVHWSSNYSFQIHTLDSIWITFTSQVWKK